MKNVCNNKKLKKNDIMKKILIILLFFITTFPLKAQNEILARQIIDTLCSPYFAGRGYVENGTEKTVEYLQNTMQLFGLQTTTNYLQPFQHSVNTFPGRMEISINNKELIAGKDYILLPTSCGISGKYKIVRLNNQIFTDSLELIEFKKKNHTEEILLIDTLGLNANEKSREILKFILTENPFQAAGILEVTENLSFFGVSRRQSSFPVIKVVRTALPRNISKIKLNIEAQFIPIQQNYNVIGFIEGKVDTAIIFGAHYDHLGKMGYNTMFPGAHDNASGVAMVLTLAEYFAQQTTKPYYTIGFALFGAEEIGLLGSLYYTENPIVPLEKTRFFMNLDIIASGENGIQVVNSTVYEREFQILKEINAEHNYFPEIRPRAPAANSDHYFFHKNNVPSFFIYTLGSYKEYHNIYDRSEGLPYLKYNEIFKTMVFFVEKLSPKKIETRK